MIALVIVAVVAAGGADGRLTVDFDRNDLSLLVEPISYTCRGDRLLYHLEDGVEEHERIS